MDKNRQKPTKLPYDVLFLNSLCSPRVLLFESKFMNLTGWWGGSATTHSAGEAPTVQYCTKTNTLEQNLWMISRTCLGVCTGGTCGRNNSHVKVRDSHDTPYMTILDRSVDFGRKQDFFWQFCKNLFVNYYRWVILYFSTILRLDGWCRPSWMCWFSNIRLSCIWVD